MALPLFRKSYAIFKKPENYPVLFHFILYDKRCKDEIGSNARLLLWEVAKNNYSEVAEAIEAELMEQKTTVDGVGIIRSEVLREYDIKLIKVLLPYFEQVNNRGEVAFGSSYPGFILHVQEGKK